MKKNYTLGQLAKDKITDFEGIIICRAEYLTGCDQYGLVPKAKDGQVKSAEFFDEGRIEITGPGILTTDVAAVQNGGPSRDLPPA
ncbi:MAG TPA: hypothetical protein VGB63_13165 [Pedobacter sp.]|jgi:hypothetical protein